MVIEYLDMSDKTVNIPVKKCSCFKQDSNLIYDKSFAVDVNCLNFSIEVDSNALDLKEILQTNITDISRSKYDVTENIRYQFYGNKLYPNLVMLGYHGINTYQVSTSSGYRESFIIQDATYSNLGNSIKSELILDLIDNVNDTPIIKKDNQILKLPVNPNPYFSESWHSPTWDVTNYRILKTANTTTYLHETNLNEYYTVIRGNNSTKSVKTDSSYCSGGSAVSNYNQHQFNKMSLLALDDTELKTLFTFKTDYAHLGYEGRLVFKTDDYLYFIDTQLVDTNISDDDKPSTQFVKLWTIDKNKETSATDVIITADLLDADSENGNNRFNTEVRDANWDTSVQGQECSPTISDYIDDLNFGLMYLGYHDANSDDEHRILNYFKKYTIDTDNNTLSFSDISVDWNNFDQGWVIPDLFYSNETAGSILTNISQTHIFTKNDTKYLVCIDVVQFVASSGYHRVCIPDFSKSYFRFRFFKFVNENNLKLLDEHIFDYSNITCNQPALAAIYLLEDDKIMLLHRCIPITEIKFNTDTSTIDVQTISYFENNEYVEENSTDYVQIYTPYYTLIQPKSKYDYNITSLYPANFNLFKELTVEIIYPENTFDLTTNNILTITVKVKNNKTHQYTNATVGLKLEENGIFILNHTKESTVDVPESGLNIDIKLNQDDEGLIKITSHVVN